MPTKATTDTSLKKTIAKPAAGASTTPRKQPASVTAEANAPNASGARQPSAAQRNVAAIKRTTPSKAATQLRPSDANAKSQGAPNYVPDTGQLGLGDQDVDSPQRPQVSDNNNGPAKAASSARPAATGAKPAPKPSSAGRPTANSNGKSVPRAESAARTTSAPQSARGAARRGVGVQPTPPRDDPASTDKKATRTSSAVRATSSTARLNSKTSSKAQEMESDEVDGKLAATEKADSESETNKVEHWESESANPATSNGSHSPTNATANAGRDENISAQLDALQDELARTQRENSELKAAGDRLTEQLTERTDELQAATKTVAEQRDTLTQHEAALETQRHEIEGLRTDNDQLKSQVADWRTQAEHANRLVAGLRADRSTLVRKFDVLCIVVGSLQRHGDLLWTKFSASTEARDSLAQLVQLREENVAQLTTQLQQAVQQHAEELETARRQFHTDLQALEDRLNKQRDELVQQIHEQHTAEVRTLRSYSDKQLVTAKAEYEKALRETEANHARQLDELSKRDEKHLRELELEHRCRMQQLESGYASSRAAFEDRIEALQADCNDLRHRVQLYEQTLQKQATVRSQIEPASASACVITTHELVTPSARSRSTNKRKANNSDSQSSGSSVSSSADSLTAACAYRPMLPHSRAALALEPDCDCTCDEPRSRSQSMSRSLQDNTLASYAHLEQEIASLNTVIELRNGEIRDLRKQLADMQRVQGDYGDARIKIRELQMQIENLEALLAIKTDSEKALTEKHNMLLRKFEKEAKASKRLSMDYEEVRFRLEQLEDAAKMRADESSNSSASSSLPNQSPMTISCPNPTSVFSSGKHRHSSASSNIPTSPMQYATHTRPHSASRPSSASSARPRSYHAGQNHSHIPSPNYGTVTMRRGRAGTAPPERGSDPHLHLHSHFGSPSQSSMRASTPNSEAWMIPLKEKAEDTGSSSANSNSTVNLSGPTVLQLDAECSPKRRSRAPTPETGTLDLPAGDDLNFDDDAIVENADER